MNAKRRWEHKQRQAGRCQKCGKPSAGMSHCPECRKKISVRQAKRYKTTVARGICGQCFKRKIAPKSKSVCFECLVKCRLRMRALTARRRKIKKRD